MGKAFKDAIGCLKDEIAIVINLLRRHNEYLGAQGRTRLFAKANPKPSIKSVPAVFKQSMNVVMLSDKEYHTTVDSAFKRKKKNAPGRPSPFGACVNVSVVSVTDKLRGMADYEPLFLTDDVMGIDKFGDAIGKPFLSPDARCRYREKFRKEMAAGVENMCIHFYGQGWKGARPDCIFIWKVPAVHGPQHTGKVALAIDTCRELAPKKMGGEAVKHFNMIMNNITDLPTGARNALRNYLFIGEPNPDGVIGDEYVQFVVNMTAGQVCLNCAKTVCLYLHVCCADYLQF